MSQGELSEPEKAYANGGAVLYQLKGTKPENTRTLLSLCSLFGAR